MGQHLVVDVHGALIKAYPLGDESALSLNSAAGFTGIHSWENSLVQFIACILFLSKYM